MGSKIATGPVVFIDQLTVCFYKPRYVVDPN